MVSGNSMVLNRQAHLGQIWVRVATAGVGPLEQIQKLAWILRDSFRPLTVFPRDGGEDWESPRPDRYTCLGLQVLLV